jgi:hypothetical protein
MTAEVGGIGSCARDSIEEVELFQEGGRKGMNGLKKLGGALLMVPF